ncbi:MAG: hypothetical protein ACJ0SL_05305 [Candidatus Rariloculaceae bacterium]
MVNGFTPALQTSDDDRIRTELGTVLFALRRLRADVASGRVRDERQILSADEIDKLLSTLCPPVRHSQSQPKKAKRFQRRTSRALDAQRSASNWTALAQSVS